MGGRIAMTLACRYPDRLDGAVSVDAAPVDSSGDPTFGFVKSVVSKMIILLTDFQLVFLNSLSTL